MWKYRGNLFQNFKVHSERQNLGMFNNLLRQDFKFLKLYLAKHSARLSNGKHWWLNGKESACNAGGTGSSPGSGRSPEKGNESPLQYLCLGNPMDCSSPGYSVQGVTKGSDVAG